MAKHYKEAEFPTKLAYISEIFDQLNHINLPFQGRHRSFKLKLVLWENRVQENIFGINVQYIYYIHDPKKIFLI